MSSIFETRRARLNERYHSWLLDVNMQCILQTGLGLNQYLFHESLTWRIFRNEIEPQKAVWWIVQAQPNASKTVT